MSESTEHADIVKWFREEYPEHEKSLRVSQFGNHRGRTRKEAAIRTAKAKAQGAVVGESDFAILVPRGTFGCFLMEYKARDGSHKLSEEQDEYLKYHNAIGNCAVACKGIDLAKAAIKSYMEAGE